MKLILSMLFFVFLIFSPPELKAVDIGINTAKATQAERPNTVQKYTILTAIAANNVTGFKRAEKANWNQLEIKCNFLEKTIYDFQEYFDTLYNFIAKNAKNSVTRPKYFGTSSGGLSNIRH